MRCGNQLHVAKTWQHEFAEWVVDHRIVLQYGQVLGHCQGDWVHLVSCPPPEQCLCGSLVGSEEIAGVDLVSHVIEEFSVAVCDDDVGLMFELGEVVHDLRVEELELFQRRLMNDHFDPASLDAASLSIVSATVGLEPRAQLFLEGINHARRRLSLCVSELNCLRLLQPLGSSAVRDAKSTACLPVGDLVAKGKSA